MGWLANLREKLNPAQPIIGGGGNSYESSDNFLTTFTKAYETIEIVNRGVNMIVDDTAEIPVHVGNAPSRRPVVPGIRKRTVEKLLNESPNPFQDINSFKRNLIIDYILDGNAFIYFDGNYLFHLPATNVQIIKDEKTYIKGYEYSGKIKYRPDEIIHIKENSFDSIFRGESRLRPAIASMDILLRMKDFQKNFFKNNAVPGLVLETPDTLSTELKNRMIETWQRVYNPTTGGRRPLILDGGLKVNALSNVSFRDMDFQESMKEHEDRVLKGLGVPPILLHSGNNANIRPNMRLYYLETIVPIVQKFNHAFSYYFGFDITENTVGIVSLQPEMRDQAQYYTSLVNGGIITVNEARRPLGLEDLEEGGDEIRVPANIAGSAANPDEGGRPNEDNDS